jgi:site-specific recombinase XerD
MPGIYYYNVRGRIQLKVKFDKENQFQISTGYKIPAKYWDASKQRPTAYFTGGTITAASLDEKKGKLARLIDDNPGRSLLYYKTLAKEVYHGKVEEKKPVQKYGICDFMKAYQEKKKNVLSSGYLRNFIATRDHIKEVLGNIEISEFGMEQFETLTEYLIEERENLNNTIAAHVKRIKTVIVDAAKRGIKINPSYLDYSIKDRDVKTFRLDWEEVEKFSQVDCKGIQQNVQDSSMIRAYTGLRFGDMELINRHTIKELGGKTYFDFTMLKNRKVSLILVPDPALDIIKRYNYKLPKISQQKHNLHIKAICKKAGIDTPTEKVRFSGNKRIVTHHEKHELITTHSFRRAFARKLFDDGIRIETISELLGHTKVQTTRVYIGITQEEGHRAVEEVFNYKGLRIAK